MYNSADAVVVTAGKIHWARQIYNQWSLATRDNISPDYRTFFKCLKNMSLSKL